MIVEQDNKVSVSNFTPSHFVSFASNVIGEKISPQEAALMLELAKVKAEITRKGGIDTKTQFTQALETTAQKEWQQNATTADFFSALSTVATEFKNLHIN